VSDTDIFLSYSREDRAAAKHFAESFAREGFTVWWDAALRSGQTFDEVIERELRAAKAVVVLWSPRSVASRWVRAEATLADRRNKLVPAIIEACDRPIIFELTHAADLADWTGDTSDSRWQTLVSDLRRLVGGGDEAAAAPPKAAEPAPEPVAEPVPEPVPEPRPVAAAPAPQRPATREPVGAKPLSPANVDDLLFAASRLREARAAARRPEPAPEENPDETQFYKRSDDFAAPELKTVHYLEKIDGARPETRFVVNPGGLTIGRTAPADIILAGSGVSRAHCQVALVDDAVLVSDLNSTNGTYIDDKRIGRTAVLPVDSVLRVGNVAFTHIVRTSTALQLQDNPLSLSRGPNFRPARVAGTS
jgi:hypothetical protein